MDQIFKISIQDSILYLSVFTEILPVIFYLFFSKNKDKSLRVVFFLLVVTVITDLYGVYSISRLQPNFLSYNIFTLFETISLYIFYRLVLNHKGVKKLLIVVISLFVIFWIFEFVKRGQREFLYSCGTFENIVVIVFAIYFFYEKIFVQNKAFIYLNFAFWVVSAYFIYAAGTFFLYLYIPSLSAKGQLKFYVLNYIFIIIRNIFLSIAMLMKNDSEQKERFKIT